MSPESPELRDMCEILNMVLGKGAKHGGKRNGKTNFPWGTFRSRQVFTRVACLRCNNFSQKPTPALTQSVDVPATKTDSSNSGRFHFLQHPIEFANDVSARIFSEHTCGPTNGHHQSSTLRSERVPHCLRANSKRQIEWT